MAKYVIRFMPDYSSTSLWPVNNKARSNLGIPIEYTTVNLSVELIEQLERFDNRVMDILDWSDPGGTSPMNKEERLQLYNEGERLLGLVREELGGDYEVRDDLGWIYPKDDD